MFPPTSGSSGQATLGRSFKFYLLRWLILLGGFTKLVRSSAVSPKSSKLQYDYSENGGDPEMSAVKTSFQRMKDSDIDEESLESQFLRHLLPFNKYLPNDFTGSTINVSSTSSHKNHSQKNKLFPSISPVIFVGGLTSSKILANLHKKEAVHFFCSKEYANYTLWFSGDSLRPFELYCWLDNIKLTWETYGNSIREVPTGVDSFLPGARWHTLNSTGGGMEGFVSDLFGLIVGKMKKKLGYRNGYEIGNFYYDFRHGPNEYAVDGTFARLKTQIELFFHNNAAVSTHDSAATNIEGTHRRVVLASVSMGSAVVHQFLHWLETPSALGPLGGRQWKSKFLERFISLSGVFKGTSLITRTTIQPDDSDLYNLKKILPWLNFDHVRDMLQTWSGNQVLQPQFMDGEVLATVKTSTWRNYTPSDLPQLFIDAGAPDVIPALVEAQKPWYFKNLRPPNVDVDCLYGAGIPVPRSFRWDHGLGYSSKVEKYDDGDAAVNLESLEGCLEWAQMDPTYFVRAKRFEHHQHGKELSSREGVNYVVKILQEIAEKNRNSITVDFANIDSGKVSER